MVDDTGSSVAGCGGAILVGALLALVFAAGSGSAVLVVIVGLFVLIALALVTWTILEIRRWEPTELHFSNWPLELGSTTTVRVIRRAKQAVPDASYKLEAELECEESATYTVGTDTRTDTREVHEDEVIVEGHLKDRTFSATFELDIPLDRGAPSMDLGNNKVEWKLDIDVDDLSRLMAKIAFTLDVVPALDPQHRNIQDTPLGGSR